MQTWQVTKEITGKQKKKSNSLPKAIKSKQEITKKESKTAENLINISLTQALHLQA